MKYETLFFDADQTLFDFEKSERTAFERTMLSYGIQYDEQVHLGAYQEINDAIWKELELGKITQEALKSERFRRFLKQLQLDFDAEEFARTYEEQLADTSFLYEGSAELIERLHQSRRLVLLTNGLALVQNRRIRKSEIGEYFDDIIISEEVGVSKPNPAIFELACRHLQNADKRKILMVGDSLTSDIQGGINFGIDTCWYNPAHNRNTKGIRPTYEIGSMQKLYDII